jgi:hypothetical protein
MKRVYKLMLCNKNKGGQNVKIFKSKKGTGFGNS